MARTIDHSLIARAQCLADGATIHDLAGILSRYTVWTQLADADQADQQAALAAQLAESQLRSFVLAAKLSRHRPRPS